MRKLGRQVPLLMSLFLVGCQVPEEAGFSDVDKAVSDRIGTKLHWKQGTEEDAAVENRLKEMLRGPLDADAAVTIALLNNPALQATYEQLGITQADVVQAGLLQNPSLHFGVRFGRVPSERDIDTELIQDFLDVLMLPMRKRLAELQFARVKSEVAHEVLVVAADTRSAYYSLVGARNAAAVTSASAGSAQVAYEYARALHTAGNLSELNMTRYQDLSEEARLELAQTTIDATEARERLNRFMGVSGPAAATWSAPEKLPDLPVEDPPLDGLETIAVVRRLDLAAGRQDLEVRAQALEIAHDFRFLGGLQAGPGAVQREGSEKWVAGPEITVQIPIFDQGQAKIAGRESALREARWRLAALGAQVRSEVRAARYRLVATRQICKHYRDVLIPVNERMVALSQREYNFMLMGAFELLEAKRHEIETYRGYITSIRDYWLARTELERAVGGRLPASKSK